MKKSSVILATMLAGFLATTGAFAKSPKDVNVVNTPTVNANIVSPNPVPVTVPDPITVNPVIQGAPVTVDTILDTVIVKESKIPFHRSLTCDQLCQSTEQILWTVPDGKVAVIEYFSCSIQSTWSSTGTALSCTINTGLQYLSSFASINHYLPISNVSTNRLSNGQLVKIYASPNTNIQVRARYSGDSPSIDPSVSYSISGYLMDAPN